eukprot:g7444.t1
MPKPAAVRPSGGQYGPSSNLLSLLLVLMLVLQPPGSRIDGAVAGEETLSSSSRRFLDPRATFYDLLGVSRHSSQQEIKRAFRKVAIQTHPDKVGPFESEEAEAEANTIFSKILNAYETISDPIRRQRYDLGGMEEETPAPMEEPGVRYEDAPFGIFVRFGGGRGGFWFRYKGQGMRRAPDTVMALPLTFEEAFLGKTTNVTVSRERLCTACKGTGAAKPEEMPTCPLCEGKGYAYHLFGVHGSSHDDHHHHHHHHEGGRCSAHGEDHGGGLRGSESRSGIPEYAHAVNTTCKACLGTGKVSDGGCPVCHGRRTTVETEAFEVAVPPGVLPGHTVTFAGKGTEHPNKLPGSVRVVAVQLAHPRFERRGADLVHKKTISLMEALLGFERWLTLLDGRRIPIVHDQVNLSGYTQEFPNRGFPVAGDGAGNTRGSLIVEFDVKFPPRLREAHLKALRVVLTEREITILEDVLKLMSARKGQNRWPEMGPEEYRHTLFCSTEGDGYDGFDDTSDPRCIPDLLWWARPLPQPETDADSDGQDEEGLHPP